MRCRKSQERERSAHREPRPGRRPTRGSRRLHDQLSHLRADDRRDTPVQGAPRRPLLMPPLGLRLQREDHLPLRRPRRSVPSRRRVLRLGGAQPARRSRNRVRPVQPEQRTAYGLRRHDAERAGARNGMNRSRISPHERSAIRTGNPPKRESFLLRVRPRTSDAWQRTSADSPSGIPGSRSRNDSRLPRALAGCRVQACRRRP